MSVEKMTLVQLFGNVKFLDNVLVQFNEIGRFHPEQPVQPMGDAAGFAPIAQENPYRATLSRMEELAVTAGLTLPTEVGEEEGTSQDETDRFVQEFQRQLTTLTDYRKELVAFVEENEEALTLLEHIRTVDADFDDIFACKFVKVRFGRLPVDSYRKLDYYSERLFVFVPLTKDREYYWGFYFTTKDREAEVEDLFSSLYFERIWIPKTIRGTPEAAKKDLEDSLAQTRQDLRAVDVKLTELVQQNKDFFLSAYAHTLALNRMFDFRRYVGVYHDEFHITGFIPSADEEAFAARFDPMDEVIVDFKPHDSDTRLQTPTKLKNNRFCKPFEMFVEMYGMPSYEEADPTPLVALTYTLLFGLMFGDLGQGLLIALGGALLAKFKNMDFGRVLVRIGLSSAWFGLVYGSVFGLEDVLDPLYRWVGLSGKPVAVMNPLTINRLLIFAVGLGVVLIVLSIGMNIVQGIRNHDLERALFSQNGLAGLVFYGAVLLGVLTMFSGNSLFSVPYVLALIVFPILVVFLKGPLGRLSRGAHGLLPEGEGITDFLVDGFFELFEVVLSFVTNTMSFLRVGGFIISHAGMMAVVLTLTEMMTGAGSVVVLIVGNLFVMALEGFIVGIQVLRLEFYEMFSHYFEGQGKPFTPIVASVCSEQ